MLKFLCLLSVVLASQAQQVRYGPFHGTADDFGNVYWTSNIAGGPPLNKLNTAVLDNFQFSFPLDPFPVLSTTAIVFAASNRGNWGAENPGGILLSSDTVATSRIVSDKSWKCKGFEDSPGISRKRWSSSEGVKANITEFVRSGSYKQWLPAVELYANFVFGSFGIRDKIPLGANWIWADGLDKNQDFPPVNVICIKDLTTSSG